MSIHDAPIPKPLLYVIEEEEDRLLLTVLLSASQWVRARNGVFYRSENKEEAEQMALLLSLEKAKPLTVYLPSWA